ncbi:gliding motility-associated-like protein [Arcticibacter pallidicorallinus]|uniref:Gliding motility-associated-like protein n=1 Tax=Arcticibacter pallidicorallinus TaxID=1259464 RepID=A0A2T0U363_9SPHI|nr:gliding motility-associated C-terminal domain-containing protein [Arcticibacter pallidicorallinus]PRY52352.1 gliding motility-associated-like protein [Arcticibacter pallidicorallinus]
MIKSLHLTTFLLLVMLFPNISQAQFPYNESFRNATAEGVVFGGAPSAFLTAAPGTGVNGTSIDPVGSGYLRLTNNTRNQKGFVYSTSSFPSSQGLSVDFEYYIYGGTGADGISLFLFDATANPFVIGGFGGSLGYAQITTTTPVSPGVSKGYLAIGLDEFGNFSNPTEGRQGGISGIRAGSVTLRGKGDGAALVPDNYRFLTSVRTQDLGFPLTQGGSARFSDPASPGYRRVYMELVPDPRGGYNITVRITRGGPSPISTTVIDKYYYPDIAPANLSYGIASSTGDKTNFHEIRNVEIDVINSAELAPPTAADDEITGCVGQSIFINVTQNDRSNNFGGAINRGSVDLNPAQPGIQSSFTIPGEGTFAVNTGGVVSFTPIAGFTGTSSTTYTVRDTYGAQSASASIRFTITPAPVQADAGRDTTINVGAQPRSYNLRGNSPGPGTGLWTQLTGPTAAGITGSSSPSVVVNNLVAGTYIFRWTITSTGGCVTFDDVVVTVNSLLFDAPDINVDGTVDERIVINVPVPEGGSIVITRPPANGTITIDPVTGQVIYVPNPGYSGPDDFEYVITDGDGNQSTPGVVTVIVNPPVKIGLAKALSSIVKNLDGSYNLRFTFTIVNFGNARIDQLNLTDDLVAAFPNSRFTVSGLSATGELLVNPAYNGTSDVGLLLPASSIRAEYKEAVYLDLVIYADAESATYLNTALVSGISVRNGALVTDQSTNGLAPDSRISGDPSPADPTPVSLVRQNLFIPGGFSPNNDGINDVLIIQNSLGRKIHLEIYNRWGNRIYRAADYQNDWNGRCTEGIHIGDDVPVGTYYYVIILDGKDKMSGYITINR